MDLTTLALIAALAAQSQAAPAATSTTTPAVSASVPTAADVATPVDPVAATTDGMRRAFAKDKNVWRVYFVREPTKNGSLVFLLAPVFDGAFPREAIEEALKCFYATMPKGAEVKLALIPKQQARGFADFEPIYARE
jgi:hypothetical protein